MVRDFDGWFTGSPISWFSCALIVKKQSKFPFEILGPLDRASLSSTACSLGPGKVAQYLKFQDVLVHGPKDPKI